MSRKSDIDALFSAKPGALLGAPNNTPPSPTTPRMRSGAIAAMGSSLTQLVEQAKIADNIESGSHIVEISTELIDASLVQDRIQDLADADIAGLMESIRQAGQQVPILVRPHPQQVGRYQIAYGHRRVRALAQLGLPVRAIIRSLNDQELVIAQGKENLERKDLSFIERARFALHLEQMEFDRATIINALATDKADLSRYLSVAKALPQDVILAIGPAPKVGRARWLTLAKFLKNEQCLKQVRDLVASPEFSALETDKRFERVLAIAQKKVRSPARKSESFSIGLSTGERFGKLTRSANDLHLSFDTEIGEKFADFLVAQIPLLAERFTNSKEEML